MSLLIVPSETLFTDVSDLSDASDPARANQNKHDNQLRNHDNNNDELQAIRNVVYHQSQHHYQ